MRIIIEPTTPQDERLDPDGINHRVVIEHPMDDISIDHIVSLVKYALMAYGFSEKTVNEYLGGDE